MKYRLHAVVPIISVFIIVGSAVSPSAKTRWSTLHLIPDADFLKTGRFVTDISGFLLADSAEGKALIKPLGLFHFGITEWVNVHIGYAGGLTLGLKARVLNESKKAVPSLALGMHNVISHQEVYLYGFSEQETRIANEFFLALGKTVDPIKTRFHLGVQTIPTHEKEKVNPFLGSEKYFGANVYASLELQYRHQEIVPSLFASWRFARRHLEVSLGLLAVDKLFYRNEEFAMNLSSAAGGDYFARPGIRLGIRASGTFGFFGKSGGFKSIDDRVESHEGSIDVLQRELDSLKLRLLDNNKVVDELNATVTRIYDSLSGGGEFIRNVLLEKLISLNALYAAEPFEPDKVRGLISEIVGYRERAVPVLAGMLLDKTENRGIRLLSAAMMGEIGHKGAESALLEVLSHTGDPGIKIECLVALGKLRTTQAMYLFGQLANDPDDAVALTAQEVIRKIERETGTRIPADITMRDISIANTMIETGAPLERFSAMGKVDSTMDSNTVAESTVVSDSGTLSDTATTSSVASLDTPMPAPVAVDSVKEELSEGFAPDSLVASGKEETIPPAIVDSSATDTSKETNVESATEVGADDSDSNSSGKAEKLSRREKRKVQRSKEKPPSRKERRKERKERKDNTDTNETW